MTLNTSDITIVEGLVCAEYPYYLVYPTSYVEDRYSYRVVKIWLSSDPLNFVDGCVDLDGTRFYEFRRSQYLELVSDNFSGSFEVPSDGDVFYTSSREAAAPSLNLDPKNSFDYSKCGFFVLLAVLAATVISRILIGGK